MKALIMLSGKLRSGKNTVSEMLKEELSKWYTVEESLLAKVLKENCRDDFKALSSFLREQYASLVSDSGVPSQVLERLSWMDVKDDHFFEDKTPLTRHLLQIYGLEIFRNRVDQDYWVKAFIDNASLSTSDVLTVTDWRFPGELECVEKSQVLPTPITIRVERPGYRKEEGQEHGSEKALDGFHRFHFVISNDDSIEELRKAVFTVAQSINTLLAEGT